MSTLSNDMLEKARKIECELLQALSEKKQKALAHALGVSESTVTRMKSAKDNESFSELMKISLTLAALGKSVNDENSVILSSEKLYAVAEMSVFGADIVKDVVSVLLKDRDTLTQDRDFWMQEAQKRQKG